MSLTSPDLWRLRSCRDIKTQLSFGGFSNHSASQNLKSPVFSKLRPTDELHLNQALSACCYTVHDQRTVERGDSVDQEQIKSEILKLRSDISSLSNKLVAAEYGRSNDVDRVVREVNNLREQANMLMHHVSPIEDIHQKSLQNEARMEKIEAQLKKRDELRKLIQSDPLRFSWLPIFALIQLALSWAIFFK